MSTLSIHRHVPLRDLTTLGVGGPVDTLVRVADVADTSLALEHAADRGLPLVVLGSGSNVIAADAGVDAVVLQIDDASIDADLPSGRIRVASGYDWDELVAWTVDQDLAGVECLSGIPGRVGAAPIQNIGAYGQEVASVVETVHAVDVTTGATVDFAADACEFGYRDSRFKRDADRRHVIVGLTLALAPGGAPQVAYAELERRLSDGPRHLARVRDTVLTIRREKSMVYDPTDPNHRSAGSFFTNPLVDDATLADVVSAAARIDPDSPLPQWPAGGDRTKLAAAWLIQRSGFAKGHVAGAAGLSTHHVLALVNRGEATAAELLALARTIRDAVFDTFGVRLRPEPVPLGFAEDDVDDLWFRAG